MGTTGRNHLRRTTAAPNCQAGWGRRNAAKTCGGMASNQSSSPINPLGPTPTPPFKSLRLAGRVGGGGNVYSAPHVSQFNPPRAPG